MNFINNTHSENEIAILKLRIEQLQAELEANKESKQILERQVQNYKYKANSFDQTKKLQILLKDRLNFIISFLRWTEKWSETVLFEGVFVRKIFEFMYHIGDLGLSSLGDSSKAPLNVFFSDKQESDINILKTFSEMVTYLQIVKGLMEDNNIEVSFSGYKFLSIEPFKDLCPAFRLGFKKDDDAIVLKIYAWKTDTNVDFDVNTLSLNKNGISINGYSEQSFIDILENINFKEAKFIKRPDVLQKQAFPETRSLSRVEKQNYLIPMYDLISGKWLKIIENQYSIYDSFPSIKIEREEECHITQCKAPYPILSLMCGHKISIMAYKGILFSETSSSESIKCPICRNNLAIQFEFKEKEKLECYFPELKKNDKKENLNNSLALPASLISSEAFDQL